MSFRTVLFAAVLSFSACDADVNIGMTNRLDGSSDAGDAGSGNNTSACNVETCGGCCDSSGVCQRGTSINACGYQGRACIQCGDDLVCPPINSSGFGGLCVAADAGTVTTRCSPLNCGGCCDDSGACQTGQSVAGCGAHASRCDACGGAMACPAIDSSGWGGECRAVDAGTCVDVYDCPRISGKYVATCANNACTYETGLRAFITRSTFKGDLGGLAGADTKCQVAATAASIGGKWKAFLSSATETAISRITGAGPWYQRSAAGDSKVFNNAANLQTNPVNGIVVDETSALWESPNGEPNYYWTGTNAGGSASSDTCAGFTSSAGGTRATVGITQRTTSDWVANTARSCDTPFHLLCFEVP